MDPAKNPVFQAPNEENLPVGIVEAEGMRSRNIKPGFFKNEYLASLSPLHRILFAGLWCYADREGRLQDRPLRIKAEVLPYDNCDINSMLDDLQQSEFIKRYSVDDAAYIQILNFLKHQNPHHRETESKIPPMFDGQANQESTMLQARDKSPGLAQGKPGTYPADSLIPDSLIPDSKTFTPLTGSVADPAPRIPPCPSQEIQEAWNRILNPAGCHRVDSIQGTRRKHLQARWKENPELQSIRAWEALFAYIRDSCPFLVGKEHSRNSPPFFITIDWLIKPPNFTKIREGQYEQRRKGVAVNG